MGGAGDVPKSTATTAPIVWSDASILISNGEPVESCKHSSW